MGIVGIFARANSTGQPRATAYGQDCQVGRLVEHEYPTVSEGACQWRSDEAKSGGVIRRGPMRRQYGEGGGLSENLSNRLGGTDPNTSRYESPFSIVVGLMG